MSYVVVVVAVLNEDQDGATEISSKKSPRLFSLCPKDWTKNGGSTCRSLSAPLKLSLQSGRTGCGVPATLAAPLKELGVDVPLMFQITPRALG